MATFRNRITCKACPARGAGRRLLTLAAALAAASLHGEIPYAEDLFPELVDLMHLAAGESPEQQLNELRVEERQGDLEVAKGQRRPRVNLYARLLAAYEWREDIDSRFRGTVNANVSVAQPLYHWGNLQRREQVAGQRVEAEQIEAERRGLELIMRLRRTYLEWLLVREQRDIISQSVRLSESYVAARRQLVDAGRSSEQDVLEMEARLLENHESLAWAEKRIIDLEAGLSQLVGPSLRLDQLKGQPLSVIQPVAESELAGLARAVQGGGQLLNLNRERLELLETIEDTNLAILDKNTWPTFDVVAGLYSDQIDGINQSDNVLRMQAFTGLQVNWNIFDGWQTDGWKRGTLARKRAFALQAAAARDEAGRRAETLLAELQLNLKQIEARGKREDILRRRLDLLNSQVDLEQVSGADLIEAEIEYLNVRQRLMEARVNYLMNLMELGALLGKDPAIPQSRSAS